MAGNPRIDELKKRLEKEPQSRLFAQLAEELRKDGDLEEAIGVAREGLQKHANYPSARMTLGRALFDTGDWKAARAEFEMVLKGAPDNILASRLLAESLEHLGDLSGAVSRYKATLALAPGDKQVLARLKALEEKPAGGGLRVATAATLPPPPASPASMPPPPPSVVARAEPPPVPLPYVDVETVREEARAPEQAPIPLVAADEHFELERPYDAPTPRRAAPPPPVPEAPPPVAPPPVSTVAEPEPLEIEFAPDVGGMTMPMGSAGLAAAVPVVAATPAPSVVEHAPPAPSVVEHTEYLSTEEFATVSPLPSAAEAVPVEPPSEPPASAPAPTPAPAPAVASAPAPVPVPVVPAPPSAEAGPAPDLASPTLAELYFNQGLTDKAIEVYRQLVEREPGNARLRDRLKDLESLSAGSRVAAAPPSSAEEAEAMRRQAIERTIARLEGMLAVIRRG